jgi:hypothetical protein
MNHHHRASGSLEADAQAIYAAMLNAVGGDPEPDIEVADVIGRHGLDPLAAVLTGALVIGLETAAAQRGRTRDELLDEYLDELFRARRGDAIRDVVADQVRTGHHPPIVEPDDQEIFVWALVSLDVRAVIDVVSGKRAQPGWHAHPDGVRADLEHRRSTHGRRPSYQHRCTPECVPIHEHPWLGCRGLQTEILTRKKRHG